MDLGRELEEDENGFFEKKQKNISALSQTVPTGSWAELYIFFEYATQVRDAYQSHVNAQQNKNMEFLTVISTIFFPSDPYHGLVWHELSEYARNLKKGIQGVIALSIIVVIVCIIFFKRKKML